MPRRTVRRSKSQSGGSNCEKGQGGGAKRRSIVKRMNKSLTNSLSNMSDFLSLNKKKRTKRAKRTKKVKKGKTAKKGKKKTNAYMKALNKARKADADSFEYNGQTYYQKTTKTGMKIYAAR